MHGRLLATLSLLAGLTLAAPAHAALLKGTVTGSPYVATASTSAIPVIFSKQTARQAGLRSPVGVVIVPRRVHLRVPGKERAVLPGRLRLGDRFRFDVRIPKAARRAVYTRLVVPKGRFVVTKRTTVLSNDELTVQIRKAQADLRALGIYVAKLAVYTQQGLASVNARIDRLVDDLAALAARATSLESTVGALADQLRATTADLQSKIDKVRSDLQAQLNGIVAQLNDLTASLGSCATGGALKAICDLQNALASLTPGTVTTLTDRVSTISQSLNTILSKLIGAGLGSLPLIGSDLDPALNATIDNALASLAGIQTTVTGIQGEITGVPALLTHVNGADGVFGTADDFDGLRGQMGGVDVGALASTVGGLTTKVGNLITAVGADGQGAVGTPIPTQITTAIDGVTGQLTAAQSALQTQITPLVNLLGGPDHDLSTTADNPLPLAQSEIAALQALTAPGGAIDAKVNTVCSQIRSALSGQVIQVTGLSGAIAGLSSSGTLPVIPGCPA